MVSRQNPSRNGIRLLFKETFQEEPAEYMFTSTCFVRRVASTNSSTISLETLQRKLGSVITFSSLMVVSHTALVLGEKEGAGGVGGCSLYFGHLGRADVT